ncbi:hypothetical protein [Anaerohalosphaera lusitana]|nr:hypothetical protein [Anaerohalosphaera lusitana]
MAFGLLAVMGFMWARVLFFSDEGPEKAQAQAMAELEEQQNSENQIEISYVQLPFEGGRHDRLENDLFGPRSWLEPETNGEAKDVAVTVKEPSAQERQRRLVEKMAETIKVEAIIVGQDGTESEAFIGNNIVTEGSTFLISYDGKEYGFTVADISRSKVIVKWNEFEVAIGMSQPDGLE